MEHLPKTVSEYKSQGLSHIIATAAQVGLPLTVSANPDLPVSRADTLSFSASAESDSPR